jgi:Regulator of G protein signaling domain
MQERLEFHSVLPPASSLVLSAPEHSRFAELSDEALEAVDLVSYDIQAIVNDKILYSSLLKYLRSRIASENLLCARAVHIFRTMAEIDRYSKDANDMAWTIYGYFVAPESAYEISLSHRRRKEVMLALASPGPGNPRSNAVFAVMEIDFRVQFRYLANDYPAFVHFFSESFEKVEKSALTALKVHYAEYIRAADIAALKQEAKVERERQNTMNSAPIARKASSCFGKL